jgi:SP family sugar:H+ symporter-like MFS transporter
MGTISGILAMPYWQDEFSTVYRDSTGHLNASAFQTATIVFILSAGTFFGAVTAAPIADLIGRRLDLVVSTFIFIFGVALQTAATAIPLFWSRLDLRHELVTNDESLSGAMN